MHLLQQLHNLGAHFIQINVDLGQISGRLIDIEVAVEGDLIADDADFAASRLRRDKMND